MFNGNNKKESKQSEKIPSTNIISKESVIQGEFQSKGSIRIEGALVGNLVTQSKLIMSETASLKGDITAENAEISGRVEGTIQVKDTLVLHEKAVIEGDIMVAKLVVVAGALLRGQCKMDENLVGDILLDKALNEYLLSDDKKLASLSEDL